MSVTVLVSTFAPFSSLAFQVPGTTSFSDLHDEIFDRYPYLPAASSLRISTHSGVLPDESCSVSSLTQAEDEALLSLRLTPRLVGGKGGFGSQLRAAGGRMSSQKTNNNDSCRDLSGRRLSTIKEAKKLAEYLEQEPERRKASQEAKRAKLEALERKLGMNNNEDGSSSTAGKKHRLEDTEYVEQSRELVDSVKSAVKAGLLKKKKVKTTHDTEPSTSSAPKTTETSTTTSKDVLGVVPVTSPAASIAAVGA